MQIVIVFSVLVVGVFCAPMLDDGLGDPWALFKRVYQKQYSSIEEESVRYVMKYLS
jgi:hypothetical protein